MTPANRRELYEALRIWRRVKTLDLNSAAPLLQTPKTSREYEPRGNRGTDFDISAEDENIAVQIETALAEVSDGFATVVREVWWREMSPKIYPPGVYREAIRRLWNAYKAQDFYYEN
jgi:hypothetical protein